MVLLVLSTFPDADTAASVVRVLVEEKLAACGNILPGVRSIYSWKGTLQDTTEVAALIKTEGSLYARLEKRLAKLHPYEVPEIVAWEPGAVAGPYAAWVASATSAD